MTSARSSVSPSPVDLGAGPVLVLGGYGAVGRAVAGALVDGGHPVVVAGRDGGRSSALAARLGPRASGTTLDVDDLTGLERLLVRASAVVVCVERNNRTIAERCIAHGVPLVDVSATPAVVDSIEALDREARRSRSTALISVGLAPGITNVLARALHVERPDATHIDLTLMFGTGGDHGAGSRRWILEGLARGHAGARPRRVALIGEGTRTAHPFPFSDQFTLGAALGTPVRTRLCFESRTLTAAVFSLRRFRVLTDRPRPRTEALVERAMGAISVGSDRFVIQASTGAEHDIAALAVSGHGECEATGRVAAAAVELLLAGEVPEGVHHLDGVVDLGFLDRLSDVLVTHELGVDGSGALRG